MSQFFFSGDDYLLLPHDPEDWLIQDLIPSEGLTNIFGQAKAGKSFAALGMAHAISTGQNDWLGFKVRKHGRVAFLQLDTPRGAWRKRFVRMKRAGYDISNMWTNDRKLLPQFPYNALEGDHVAWLKNELDKLAPVLVFIDTLREVHSGDENDATTMKNVISNLINACGDAAICVLSHSRKPGRDVQQRASEDIISSNRGSNYIAGKMDSIIQMTAQRGHPYSMSWTGRATEGGRVLVVQNKKHQLLELNGLDVAYWALLRSKVEEWKTDPAMFYRGELSVNRMAQALAALTSEQKDKVAEKGKSQCTIDINTHLNKETDDDDLLDDFVENAIL